MTLMRPTLIRFVTGAAIVAGSMAHAQVSMTAIIRDHKLSATEAAAAVLIADALKLDATFVISTGRNTGAPLVALGPAFVLSRECGRPVGDIWRLRRQGKGWGVIAKEMGMHPGTFNKMRRNGDFDRNAWVVLAEKRYSYRDDDFRGLEKQGLGRGDVITAVVISGGDRSKMKSAVSDYKRDKSWKVGNGGSGKSHDSDNGKGSEKGSSKGGNSGKGKGKGKG